MWPEHWGMTRGQVKQLLLRIRKDPAWTPHNNVYTLVQDFVVPWTRGKGLGYALMINERAPKEVNVMVSHAWGENAEEFLEAVLRSTGRSDVVFVCALSLYQGEDGVGPTIEEQLGCQPSESPFRRVLSHIRFCGDEAGWRWRWRPWLGSLPGLTLLCGIFVFCLPTLLYGCVPTFTYCMAVSADSRFREVASMSPAQLFSSFLLGSTTWIEQKREPQFAIYAASALVCGCCSAISWLTLRRARIYDGRMVVVPNREIDLYSRLWCVYEIYVATELGVRVEVARTLARAGRLSSRLATCGCQEDTNRIHSEIQAGSVGYEQIDQAVWLTTRGARWNALKLSLGYGLSIAIFIVAYLRVKGSDKNVAAIVAGILLACVFDTCAIYGVFRRANGMPSLLSVLALSLALAMVGFIILCIDRHYMLSGWYAHLLEQFAFAVAISAGYLICFVVAATIAVFCFPRLSRVKSAAMPVLAGMSLSLLSIMTGCEAGSSASPLHSIYPSVVSNACFVAGFFFVPAYLCWSAAVRWGVRIRKRPTCRSNARER